jgi:histone-lysine N-methyltransferase SETMAR
MKIERLAHPPYSPDMSQRNFDFVGWTKTALQNRRFTDADAMVRALTDLFDNVTFDELQSVFQNWIERLKSVIIHNGEYFIKWLIKVPLVPSSSRNRRGGHYFFHPL